MVLANRGYNSLFDNMFRDPFYGRSQERTETQVMRTDIYEKDGNDQLKRQRHNKVLRNIGQPDDWQCTPLS